ncbi:hypothetical protein [Salinarimonas sp.]|uniref:hypothetical protein n=1 Tax=Salinarimonas sp. TaxID=2766526 RepID=UPI0032D8B551
MKRILLVAAAAALAAAGARAQDDMREAVTPPPDVQRFEALAALTAYVVALREEFATR